VSVIRILARIDISESLSVGVIYLEPARNLSTVHGAGKRLTVPKPREQYGAWGSIN